MKNILLLAILIVSISCIEIIEIETDKHTPVIVFSGTFSDIEEVQDFFLQYSAPLNGQSFESFTEAEVYIKSEDGDSFLLTEIEPGKYSFFGKAEVGKRYFVEIYKESNLLARSEVESVPTNFPLDSLSFEETFESYTNSDGNVRNLKTISIYGNTSSVESAQDYYLRFGEIETVFLLPEIDTKTFPPEKNCYIYNYDISPELELFELKEGDMDLNIKSKIFAKPINYEFAYVMSIKASLISYTEESFEYWKELETLYNQSGQITDKVPAQFRGNIKNYGNQKIIGNFSVVSKSEDLIFIARSDLDYKPLKLCGEVGGPYPNNVVSACYECLLHEGSTTLIPEYW